MASPQTTETVTKELYGSVQIELSFLSPTSWIDVGAVNGCTITENLQISTLENHNAQDRTQVTDQTATIEFGMFEIINENIDLITRAGLDTTSTIAGTPVAGATQALAIGEWGFKEFVPIENQNGDGTVPTVNSVTGSTDGALIDEDDYLVVQDQNGVWGVAWSDSSATTLTTENQTMTIDYDYTPNATARRSSGGLQDLDEFQVRLTNTETISDVSKTRRFTFFKCTLGSGKVFEFQKYNSEDTRVFLPTSINAKLDTTLTKGAQLYQIDDITN